MNHIIIKIESGVVAEMHAVEPVRVTIVDYDVLEGGETFEERMKKAVISTTTERHVEPQLAAETVRELVRECRRPRDLNMAESVSGKAA